MATSTEYFKDFIKIKSENIKKKPEYLLIKSEQMEVAYDRNNGRFVNMVYT